MMTVPSGILLLLFVSGYQAALMKDTPGYALSIEKAFGKYTKDAKVQGVPKDCYKNFANLVFDKWLTIDTLTRVKNPIQCDEACTQTKDCSHFLFTNGSLGFRSYFECALVKKYELVKISPTYSGSATCKDRKCMKRDHGFSRKHLIAFKDRSGSHSAVVGTSLENCQARCQDHSGDNWFPPEDIDWKPTYYTLKQQFPDGKIPCGAWSYYYGNTYIGYCRYYAVGAKPHKIIKIAGPTPACKSERESTLEKALAGYTDHKGYVYPRSKNIGHFERIINPDDCNRECYDNGDCQQFLVVIGMLENSGCWLFPGSALKERTSVMSGIGSCTTERCLQYDVAYGRTYEIVLHPQHAFTSEGIEACQKFCADHSGSNTGFPWRHVDWAKTGGGIKPTTRFYECVGYTYVETTGEGFFEGPRKCRIFGGKVATMQDVLLRYGRV